MVSFLSLAALALLPTVLAQLMVNTPQGVVQCQPVQITWSGGSPPFFLSLLPGGQPTAQAIKQFPSQNGNTFTWNADLVQNTLITISLKDSSGTQVFSQMFTIQPGNDSSCINTSVADSGTGGVVAPSNAPATSTSASSGAKSASSGTASATGSAASSGSTKASGASINRGSALAVAGVMGLVGAVLF